MRATNAKTEVTNKISYDHAYRVDLTLKKKENEVLHKNTLAYKQQMHEKQRTFEQSVKDASDKRHPFNAKINNMQLQNATLIREQRN